MRASRRALLRAGAAIAGAALGASLVLAVGQQSTEPRGGDVRAAATHQPGTPAGQVSGPVPTESSGANEFAAQVILAWAPGGLPAETERTIEKLTGVQSATTVSAHLDWIESSKTADGRIVDRPPEGMSIPFELAAVEPLEYAEFVTPEEATAIRDLGTHDLVLARTAAEIRGAGPGLEIDLQDGTGTVESVVSDSATNGYEALVSGPGRWDGRFRFVLARVEGAHAAAAVKDAVRTLMGPDADLVQFRTEGENPYLRYGDAVLPQMLVKEKFGEFAAVARSDGTVEVDPAWRTANIVQRDLPLVGPVTCHRDLIPQLVSALDELRDEGLGHLVHPEQFAGCYSPRFISQDPEGNLSHHAWGMAVDLNANENPRGGKPHMDARIVDAFQKWGFTWGGRWILPDGMHFEWISPP